MIVALLSVTFLGVRTAHAEDVLELRARGQAAVDELHAQWKSAEAEQRVVLQQTLDAVCAQKDCQASRLFWYTDLDEAKAAAQRLGRPILALHLLGRLDQELSCANSRFFRTLLYSDDAISSIMREQYVLYWHSVRDVPVVTIDLGGGLVIHQTITGNSVHYLLAPDGTPLDLLPGLYSPAEFHDRIEWWATLAKKFDALPPAERAAALVRYHQGQFVETGTRAATLGIDRSIYDDEQPVWVAQLQSQSKAVTEMPLLRQLKGERAKERRPVITDHDANQVAFSASTLRLMNSKQPLTAELLANLRRTIAGDTMWNEYDLHRRAHAWFANGEVVDLQSLNERVYDELFLTPSSDPWLGLRSDSVFNALEQPPIPPDVLAVPASILGSAGSS
jgi:hypothetical protein